MTEREKTMSRFQELAAGERWLANTNDLLHACLNPNTSYADYFRSDREPTVLSEDLLDEVQTLYRAVAVAPELSSFAKKRICLEACEKFLATVMSTKELDAFKKNNPLREDYDPDFINLAEALERVEASGLFDENVSWLVPKNRTWGSAYAAEVVDVALGGIKINERSAQQLWLAVCRNIKDVLKGETPATRSIQMCLCKVANEAKWQLTDPIDFTVLESVGMWPAAKGEVQ